MDSVLLAMEGVSTCTGGETEVSMALEDTGGWTAVFDFTFNPPPLAIVNEIHMIIELNVPGVYEPPKRTVTHFRQLIRSWLYPEP